MSVYFIRQKHLPIDFIKIGVADNPKHRLIGMQTGNPIKLYLDRVVYGNPKDSYKLEKLLHKKFRRLNVLGEWFKALDEIEDFIELISDYSIENAIQITKDSLKNKNQIVINQPASNYVVTKKETEILDFIKNFIHDNGCSPTLLEIGNNTKIKSKGTVHRYVKSLQEKGLINQVEKGWRNLELIKSA